MDAGAYRVDSDWIDERKKAEVRWMANRWMSVGVNGRMDVDEPMDGWMDETKKK